MRILGIDYGTKRIGIAISDPNAQFALPHSVLQNSISKKQSVIDAIISIATANAVQKVIVGESRDYKGVANKILPDVLELKKELEKHNLTVHLELEFMTSQQAERFQGKTQNTDASAAALILQSYLDSHKNK
ncbi:MAG: RuvX/YqgF family protein [Candidatus Pacebacteria bacterium]|nr:RuvX/YqgF family protein [Candidatus Paceibacterota bacterium]